MLDRICFYNDLCTVCISDMIKGEDFGVRLCQKRHGVVACVHFHDSPIEGQSTVGILRRAHTQKHLDGVSLTVHHTKQQSR